MNAIKTLRRNFDIRLSDPRQYVRDRIAERAAHMDRAGVLAAKVELCNEALNRLVELIYRADDDGVLANVDVITYRLLIPAPWGKSGYKQWGLRETEAEALNRVLRGRQTGYQKGQRPPLFVYDAESRTWHVNLPDYPNMKSASFWLKGEPIRLEEFRAALAQGKRQGKV